MLKFIVGFFAILSSLPALAETQDLNLNPIQFSQSIDHSVPGSAKFNQRVWISNKFARSSDSPVLFRFCGESPCEHHIEADDLESMASALQARVVYVEHRYYGYSQPFNDLTTEHLKFLTIANALADFAELEKSLIQTEGWTGKWIAIGGSYSGTLSALYRLKYPSLVVGALASSAPLRALNLKALSANDGEDTIKSPALPTDVTEVDRQWTYQACTELNYWFGFGTNKLYIPRDGLCFAAYGLHRRVANSDYNRNFYLPFVTNSGSAPSHILFTLGAADMWTQIGIDASKNQNKAIQILTIAGAGHHDDINRMTTTTQSVQDARALFLKLAKSWIEN